MGMAVRNGCNGSVIGPLDGRWRRTRSDIAGGGEAEESKRDDACVSHFLQFRESSSLQKECRMKMMLESQGGAGRTLKSLLLAKSFADDSQKTNSILGLV